MTKYLNGSEIVGFIKERQAKQVRALRQSWRVIPKLAIIKTHDNPVSDKYIEKKLEYAKDILIEVDVYKEPSKNLPMLIERLNKDESVHGIIIQLPIDEVDKTEELVNLIDKNKDVDGLGENAAYTSATAMAIDWLLSAYNVNLFGKDIVILGKGRLVGGPLYDLWTKQSLKIRVIDQAKDNLAEIVGTPDILVTATGSLSIVTRELVKPGAIIVDAGTTSENGQIVGDVSEDVYSLDDITITPKIGGVGPVTVAALFDNVIRAARVIAEKKGQQDL